MSGQWSVSYGGNNDDGDNEWAYERLFDVEAAARECFDDLIRNPPSEGAWPMDYALLANPAGTTVGDWDSEEEEA